jgi:hypothetical protein
MLKDKDKKATTKILEWWNLMDLREATIGFVTERTRDEAAQYIEHGTENLTPRHLKINGMQKIVRLPSFFLTPQIKVSSNMTEFSATSPLRPETINVPKVLELLGNPLFVPD